MTHYLTYTTDAMFHDPHGGCLVCGHQITNTRDRHAHLWQHELNGELTSVENGLWRVPDLPDLPLPQTRVQKPLA